jgi:hypothetical protein
VKLLDDEPGWPEVLGDSAYGTGDARAALTAAGHRHTAVIKPARLRPAGPDEYTIDDFAVEEKACTGTRPKRRDPAHHR